MNIFLIEFADNGQDSLYWLVNDMGVVIHSEPFQSQLWGGCTLIKNPAKYKPGDYISIIDKTGSAMEIIHKIKSIQEHNIENEKHI